MNLKIDVVNSYLRGGNQCKRGNYA